MACNIPSEIVVFGSEGILTVPQPWLPSTPCRTARDPLPPETEFPPSTLLLQQGGFTSEITVEVDRDLFSYEADMVADHISARQAPAMNWADSLGNMQLMDRWRAEIGLSYPQDSSHRAAGLSTPLSE